VSSVCGHSAEVTKQFYLLEDRKADVLAVDRFSKMLSPSSEYESVNAIVSSPSYASHENQLM
jgi:hypothetical protein